MTQHESLSCMAQDLCADLSSSDFTIIFLREWKSSKEDHVPCGTSLTPSQQHHALALTYAGVRMHSLDQLDSGGYYHHPPWHHMLKSAWAKQLCRVEDKASHCNTLYIVSEAV